MGNQTSLVLKFSEPYIYTLIDTIEGRCIVRIVYHVSNGKRGDRMPIKKSIKRRSIHLNSMQGVEHLRHRGSSPLNRIVIKYNNPHILLLEYLRKETVVGFKSTSLEDKNVRIINGSDGAPKTEDVVVVYRTAFLIGYTRGDIAYQVCDEYYQYKDKPNILPVYELSEHDRPNRQ